VSEPRTKLICTLGPASATPKMVAGLVRAGASVFRINLSHGTPEDHERSARLVREAEAESGRSLALLADLTGPKVRLGELRPDPFAFRVGGRFELRPGGPGDATGAATTHPGLGSDLRAGDRVLLADGAVELAVTGIADGVVRTEVVRGGVARSRQGVNVPAERLGLPAVTDRDREALDRMLDLGVDLVAQSFVREAGDVEALRGSMDDRAVPIVAKIETGPAVRGIGPLVGAADAIMVARGDLGVELPMEEIPLLQKDIIRLVRAAGKPAIVATQMLESMIRTPRPTRAEASDVANAVLDGADAIMLSGETAVGEYPFEAASTAVRIAAAAEAGGGAYRIERHPPPHTEEAGAVARAAAEVAASGLGVAAIACYTETGRTAGLLSAERPAVPIFAFIPDERPRRHAALRWGVTPLPAGSPPDTDAMIALMDEGLRARGFAQPGQVVVMVAASPAGRTTTNMLKVHQIGSS
jgi:pyruvate kinase